MATIYKGKCNFCNKIYTGYGEKFCSWNCKGKNQERRKEIVCLVCKTKVSVKLGRKNAKTCSRKCQGISMRNPNTPVHKIEYHSTHVWLKNKLGSAKRCKNPNCSGLGFRFEWACKNRKPDRNIKNYIELCSKCHRHYDAKKISLKKLFSITVWEK